MTALADLIALRDDLTRQIAERQAQERAEKIAKGREALAALGLTPEDYLAVRVPRAKRTTVAVKYRGPNPGETWTGRGKQPVWLRDAIAGGVAIEHYAVKG